MNGDNVNPDELDGLSGSEMFSNANGCRHCRSNTLAFLTDLSLRAHTAQPCCHIFADTYQDYIILPGHINFGAEAVDTSTQVRELSQGRRVPRAPPKRPRPLRRSVPDQTRPPPRPRPPTPPMPLASLRRRHSLSCRCCHGSWQPLPSPPLPSPT